MSYKKLTFNKIIRKNEFRALIGWRFQTLIFLTAIFFITFLCFGFARNAFEQVNELKNDPLSNWINIKFTGKSETALRELYEELEVGLLKDTFMIKNADFYTSSSFSFLLKSHTIGLTYDYRTIDPMSPIVEDLVNEFNIEENARYYTGSISATLQENPKGLIVTRNLLEKLGYGNEKVEQVDVICTNTFLCNYLDSAPEKQDTFTLKIMVEDLDLKQALALRDDIGALLGFDFYGNIIPEPDTVFFPDTVLTWHFDIPDEGLKLPAMEKFRLISEKLPILKQKNFGYYADFELNPDCSTENQIQDYLALDFQRLDRIRDFDRYIKEAFGVSMNMETLEQRENYLFIGNLALASILLVIVFCVFSLTLYISETFKNHILKVKKNLGNLMALGASNNELISLYLGVALKIMIYAILIAFIASFLLGWLFETYFLDKLVVLQQDVNYFNLLNSWLVIFIVLIVVIALLMTFLTIRRILKVSPGDLIYERDNVVNTRNGNSKRPRSA